MVTATKMVPTEMTAATSKVPATAEPASASVEATTTAAAVTNLNEPAIGRDVIRDR